MHAQDDTEAIRNSKFSARQHKLRRLIEEATVDCDDEWEQATGFLVMMQNHIACPFTARVIGEPVRVVDFDNGEGGTNIVARCKRHGKTYKIGALSLEWDGKPPKGVEWVEAYRAWLQGA